MHDPKKHLDQRWKDVVRVFQKDAPELDPHVSDIWVQILRADTEEAARNALAERLKDHLLVSNDEILEYTFAESEKEVWSFRAGWIVRRVHGPWQGSCIAKQLPWICNATQPERISFERGWYACDAVRTRMLIETENVEAPSGALF